MARKKYILFDAIRGLEEEDMKVLPPTNYLIDQDISSSAVVHELDRALQKRIFFFFSLYFLTLLLFVVN